MSSISLCVCVCILIVDTQAQKICVSPFLNGKKGSLSNLAQLTTHVFNYLLHKIYPSCARGIEASITYILLAVHRALHCSTILLLHFLWFRFISVLCIVDHIHFKIKEEGNIEYEVGRDFFIC